MVPSTSTTAGKTFDESLEARLLLVSGTTGESVQLVPIYGDVKKISDLKELT
jgi:hypothetical protein